MNKFYRADRVRGIMAAKKITTTELSKRTGFGHTTIVALRKGGDTRVSTLLKIAEAMSVPLSYFFGEDAI